MKTKPSLTILLTAAMACAILWAGTALAQDWPDPATVESVTLESVTPEDGTLEDGTPDASEAVAETAPIVRRIPGEAPSLRSLVQVRDAETGEMRAPTEAEWAKLASTLEPLNRSAAGLVETYYPDGTVGVALDGRFQSMSVVHRDAASGQLEPHCNHDAHTITQWVTGADAETEEASDER
jgi:hypothetical protein